MSDKDWVQRETYNHVYDDRQRLAAIVNEADDVIRELLDVITGWVGNPELRADPSRYDTTKANDFLGRLNDALTMQHIDGSEGA